MFPFLSDLADSFDPLATGDLGCVSVRYVRADGTGEPTGETLSERRVPIGATGRLPARAKKKKSPEVAAAERRSLALIQLMQAAIAKRENALLKRSDSARDVAGIGRLALLNYGDQDLAREDIEETDLDTARVDMTELLPLEWHELAARKDAMVGDDQSFSSSCTDSEEAEPLAQDETLAALPPSPPPPPLVAKGSTLGELIGLTIGSDKDSGGSDQGSGSYYSDDPQNAAAASPPPCEGR